MEILACWVVVSFSPRPGEMKAGGSAVSGRVDDFFCFICPYCKYPELYLCQILAVFDETVWVCELH